MNLHLKRSQSSRAPIHKIPARQLRQLLETHFDVISEASSSEEIVILCPEPGCGDSKGKRSFNTKSNLVHCWRCGQNDKSPHLAVLWLRHHGIEVEATDLSLDLEPELIEAVEVQLEKPIIHAQQIELPPGFTLLADEPDCAYGQLIEKMAIRKHLELQDFIDAGVGFTREDSYWEPFAIFPTYELGKLVYYQGRSYGIEYENKAKHTSTKQFPSKKYVPLGASHWLYGFDSCLKQGTQVVIVVESILNVLSLRKILASMGITGVEVVAVFKHSISAPQKTKLLASPAKEICLMFDGDATSSAWKEAKLLSGSRTASVATMPVGIDGNDNAELAIEKFIERECYNSLGDLMALI